MTDGVQRFARGPRLGGLPVAVGVMAPALGIYAVVQSAADVAPWLTPSSPDWAAAETYVTTVLAPAHQAERTRFDTEVPNSTMLELDGADHSRSHNDLRARLRADRTVQP